MKTTLLALFFMALFCLTGTQSSYAQDSCSFEQTQKLDQIMQVLQELKNEIQIVKVRVTS